MALVQKFPGDDEALVRRMQWPFLQAEGHINVESVMQIQGWWVREGWLNQVLPPDRWYDRRLSAAPSRRSPQGGRRTGPYRYDWIRASRATPRPP